MLNEQSRTRITLGTLALVVLVSQGTARDAHVRSTDRPSGALPFPQNTVYPFGIMPSNRNHLDALASYLVWKNTYVTSDGACGYRRVLFNDRSTTYSEGIGYGMLLAVCFDDQPLFDDLWRYYQAHVDTNGLMHWWIGSSCGQIIETTAATDADQDAAFALLLANRQWGSAGPINYYDDALTLINAIMNCEVEPGTFVLKPGDFWGGSHITNPSYFSPGYYRAFAEATGNADWYSVLDRCYEILSAAAHPVTGLVPDWCSAAGLPVPGFGYYYYYDATRTPWRIALDYMWYGEARARAFCAKISSFARTIGSVNIREGYQLDGSPIGWQHLNVFVGPFGVGGMATHCSFQAFADSAYDDNVTTVLPAGYGQYYNGSLKTLTLLVQTGNFLSPNLVPVPIQLSYVRGSFDRAQRAVVLEWGTVSEVNNSGFEVQRKAVSGGEFVLVPNSFVPGHGTTTIPQHYTFTDSTVSGSAHLYRLKQIDLDGRYTMPMQCASIL